MTNVTREQRRLVFERMVGKRVAQKYQITGLLGFGGMGAVYEAVQYPMERKVALKLIPTYDQTAVTRFEREATTVSKLSHPNTVTVFDFGQTDDGHLYLSMEYLVGRTLSDVIRERGTLPAKDLVHIAAQICRALGEAHRMGIIHRDIKPDNIFLIQVDRDPYYVKVLDFGIAKAVHGEPEADLTADGRIIGTPRYMSPEQILAQPIDHRVDIYSLGCILFEMACGAPPFGGNNTAALMMSHAQQLPPSFASRLTSEQLRHLPPGLEAVIQRTLAKNPNARPQTTEALLKELEQALSINQAYDRPTTPMPLGAPPAGPPQAWAHPQPPLPGGQRFEHHTGEHPPQTGNFPQPMHAFAAQTGSQLHPHTGTHTGTHPGTQTGSHFGAPLAGQTGSQTGGFAIPAPKPNRTPLILAAVTGVVFAALLGVYALQDRERAAQQTPAAPPALADQTATPEPLPDSTRPPKAPPEALPDSPKTGTLSFRVRTEPEGADIFEGKTFIASTPHTFTLEEGSQPRRYTIKLKNYKEESIVVDPNKPEDNFFDIALVSTRSKTKASIKVSRDQSPAQPATSPPQQPAPTAPTKPIDRLPETKTDIVERLD